MSAGKKILWGLGLAGGALLAAWLLTGDRKKKAKEYIGKQAKAMKDAMDRRTRKSPDETDAHYI
jgi:hypothetical protein